MQYGDVRAAGAPFPSPLTPARTLASRSVSFDHWSKVCPLVKYLVTSQPVAARSLGSPSTLPLGRRGGYRGERGERKGQWGEGRARARACVRVCVCASAQPVSPPNLRLELRVLPPQRLPHLPPPAPRPPAGTPVPRPRVLSVTPAPIGRPKGPCSPSSRADALRAGPGPSPDRTGPGPGPCSPPFGPGPDRTFYTGPGSHTGHTPSFGA